MIVPLTTLYGPIDADGYPYYVFLVVGVVDLLLGVVYWLAWTRIWPKIGGYKIVVEKKASMLMEERLFGIGRSGRMATMLLRRVLASLLKAQSSFPLSRLEQGEKGGPTHANSSKQKSR